MTSFVKARYSGLIGHNDGQPDDDAGCAAGESEGGPVGGRRALRLCFRGHSPCQESAAASVRKGSLRARVVATAAAALASKQ
jgi:hypothetical protein